MDYLHQPIMTEIILEYLDIQKDSIFCDMTLGEGGHAISFLSKLNKEGIFIGIDRNQDIFKIAKDRIENLNINARCFFKNANFSEIEEIVSSFDIKSIDYFFYDLGISMYHLKNLGKGFSFLDDSSLEMNLDSSYPYNAEEIIHSFSEKDLADLFWIYGEEKASYFFAKRIVEYRKKTRILSAKHLGDLCLQWKGKSKIHPATKIFQALRIYINQEFYHLALSLFGAVKLLSLKGRIAILTFHSLEDRIVKQIFNFFIDIYKNQEKKNEAILKKVNKKVIQASYKERSNNPASRSAKLRVVEKINHLSTIEWDSIWNLYQKNFILAFMKLSNGKK